MAFYNENINNHNIIISFTTVPRYEFGAFAEGYHKAAKVLAEYFLEKKCYPDFEGYPIVFLYRHAFELNLKNIIYWSTRLSYFKNYKLLDSKLYNNHNLTELSNVASKIIGKLFSGDSELIKLFKTIKRVAKEFNKIDSNSYSYRYPIDKKGNYSTKPHQVVKIASIYKNMEHILDNLETINFGLDIETSKAQELFEYLNSEFRG